MAKVVLLGRARLVAAVGDAPAEPAAGAPPPETVFPADKRHQLLAYLAYQADWVERPRLAALWWPEADDGTAMQNLRQLVRRARGMAPWVSALEVDAHRLRWRVPTDVGTLRQALAAGDGAALLGAYRGPLMAGLEGYEGSGFGTWLELEREHLHAEVRRALLTHARGEAGAGRHDEAAGALDRLLVLDPFDEEALTLRLEHAVDYGLTTGSEHGLAAVAQQRYRAFVGRLAREFDLEPSVATVALARRLDELLEAARTTGLAERDALPATPAAAEPTEAAASPSAAAEPTEAAASRAHLPNPGTTFVGRDLEVAEVAARLRPGVGRLVTLVGPSGIGKTRLAIEAARELAPRYLDGAAFVALAEVRTGEGLVAAVAAAVGWSSSGREATWEDLGRYLERRTMLLVLDNFEQLLAASESVAALQRVAPAVDVLVTSHERLGLSGEWVVTIGGLASPDGVPFPDERRRRDAANEHNASPWRTGAWAVGSPAAADAESSDAVRLFVDRAQRVRPGFALTPERLVGVVAVCHLVHGSPLGIELAAAWARVLEPHEIAAEIAGAPDFLASAARDVPERHRSLRAAFSYSWSLLADAEREVLPRLAVFRGGFTRAAAAAVAGANLAVLAALIDKALVRTQRGRFDVHPLLHAYLAEVLATLPDEPDRSRERHAHYVLGIVERPEGRAPGAAQRAWLQDLQVEHANVMAALGWAVEAQDTEVALRLVGPLQRHWTSRGALREGQGWVDRVLALPGADRPSLALATACNTAGSLALLLARYPEAEAHYARSRAVARAIGHEGAMARVAIGAGLAASRRGEVAAARRHYQDGLELQRRLANREAVAGLLNNLAVLALDQGDADEAARWLLEGLEEARALGDTYLEGTCRNNLGWAAWLRGDIDQARTWLESGLAACRAVADVAAAATALNNLALVRARHGDREGAVAAAREALTLRTGAADRWGVTYSLDVHAVLAADVGDDTAAATLWGAADALRAAIGSPLAPGWSSWQGPWRAAVRGRMGEDAYALAFEGGRGLDTDVAVQLAAGGAGVADGA